MNCPKCKSMQVVKSGTIKKRQRFLCKICKHQFIEVRQAHSMQKDHACKRKALLLYVLGFPLRKIAKLLQVSPATIFYWQRQWGTKILELRDKTNNEVYSIPQALHYISSKNEFKSYTMLLADLETDIVFMIVSS